MTEQQNDLKLKNAESSDAGPVTCLGMTFENDEARRAHFTEELRKKLKDPEFRKIEGFPIGDDEDILALSDPPYYTACANPWIADLVQEFEARKPQRSEALSYHREPFAVDVSEGRSGIFYDAHSYHTKVPHKAIMRYLLHYTEPGDIVFDGFCGTGMTGVAAQMCGDRAVVSSLGYRVKPDGVIMQQEQGEDGKNVWQPFAQLGERRAVLNDLSPAATFIASNYNTPINATEFQTEAKRILKEVEEEFGWMYETLHVDNKTKGRINYIIWSDVFVCTECTNEIVFWENAIDKTAGKVYEQFPCPACGSSLSKRSLDHAWNAKYDRSIDQVVKQAKRVPVLINYTVNGKRAEKTPDSEDLAVIEKINEREIPYWFPSSPLMDGSETLRNVPIGISHTHHFYTTRSLWILSALRSKAKKSAFARQLAFLISSYDLTHSTLMTRIIFKAGGKKPVLTGYQSGTLYISSLPVEKNVFEGILKQKLPIVKNSLSCVKGRNPIFTASAHSTGLRHDSVDYLFFDPPFGSNLNYSELNFLWEAWIKVLTNIQPEAIENKRHKKDIEEYRRLMTLCFKEAYRVLKPGRWMTVEFSNTKAAVWNSIQAALADAGFIVANVSVLDKKQGTFKAVTTPTAVKQDLVISAYKPNGGFEERFSDEAQSEEGVWDFVRTHLKYLPVTKRQGSALQLVPERDPRILYDQTVAYFVRQGYSVPISSREFQIGLAHRFVERDGMYFLPDQAAEYDRNKVLSGEMVQTSLFVSDEESAIQWLRQVLKQKPQTFSDINPQFMKQLGGWSKNEAQLDLKELLNQNFILYDGKGPVPEQIHAYLSSNWRNLRNLPKDAPELVAKAKDRWYVPDPSKAGDLEKLRERALLREFEAYVQRSKKFSVRDKFRLEALRAGFKKAWQNRDYALILDVAAKIPDKILEEDQKLLMWRDNAQTRLGDD